MREYCERWIWHGHGSFVCTTELQKVHRELHSRDDFLSEKSLSTGNYGTVLASGGLQVGSHRKGMMLPQKINTALQHEHLR